MDWGGSSQKPNLEINAPCFLKFFDLSDRYRDICKKRCLGTSWMGWGPVDWVGRVLPEAKFENKCTLFFEFFLFERPIPRYLLKTVLPCKALGFSYGLITAVHNNCWWQRTKLLLSTGKDSVLQNIVSKICTYSNAVQLKPFWYQTCKICKGLGFCKFYPTASKGNSGESRL